MVIMLNSFLDFLNLALMFFLLSVELVLIHLEQIHSLSPFVSHLLFKNIIGFLVGFSCKFLNLIFVTFILSYDVLEVMSVWLLYAFSSHSNVLLLSGRKLGLKLYY